MQQVICKLNCYAAVEGQPEKTWVGTDHENQAIYQDITPVAVTLGAVYKTEDKPENDVFAVSTPSAHFTLRVMNEAIRTSGFFEPGYEYLVTFEKVSK